MTIRTLKVVVVMVYWQLDNNFFRAFPKTLIVIFYSNFLSRFQKAIQWFEKTLTHIASSLSEMWEPTLVNLAHAQRKLKYVYIRLSIT